MVNRNTSLDPGIPLLYVGGWGLNTHFGACLTPLPDGSLLVYKSLSDHPLGLVPGDLVLGYDGVPWKILYEQLIAAQLPIAGNWWGSCESAYEHSWLISAGMNWHLFDTIDIVKYATGDTLHLSTGALAGLTTRIFGSEQMDIPGVPKPDPATSDYVSWGIVSGTQIGYIYVMAWSGDAEDEFYAAVNDLMFNYSTSGLIIDFRTNFGGNMHMSNPGLELLFNTTVETIGFAGRSDPYNHLAMEVKGSTSQFDIVGDPSTYYDKPIAVLTGPGAVSSGDQVALRLKFHPRARIFGKSTSAAFNSPTSVDVGNDWWSSKYATADAFLVSAPGHYLTHDEFVVDEEVWLTQDDVAQGHDTVVEAAIDWINTQTATLLQFFSASSAGGAVELEWTLSAVDEGIEFRILRSMDGGAFTEIDRSKIESMGLAYRYVDSSVLPGRRCAYRVEYETGGQRVLLFATQEIETAVASLALHQNKPNPFNPSTTISFYLPAEADVTLEIYDVGGRLVTRPLHGEKQSAGPHDVVWDGRDSAGRPVASGLYVYRLVTGKENLSSKMVLLR